MIPCVSCSLICCFQIQQITKVVFSIPVIRPDMDQALTVVYSVRYLYCRRQKQVGRRFFAIFWRESLFILRKTTLLTDHQNIPKPVEPPALARCFLSDRQKSADSFPPRCSGISTPHLLTLFLSDDETKARYRFYLNLFRFPDRNYCVSRIIA